MKCPRCLQDNLATPKFCEHCGFPLDRACAVCGGQVSALAKFCPHCGCALEGFPRSADDRFASPGSYTPRHLAEKILTSRAALEGERKQVTVLFADLKGSMELLANRDPEEARRICSTPSSSCMMEAVHHYEGTVNQVMGDGIMALFGAPLAHEDHAVRACYAALRMQDGRSATTPMEIAARPRSGRSSIRVGLNSGEVVVRSIGNDLRMDYSAVGQTTHLAARMEQMAETGFDPRHRRHPPAGPRAIVGRQAPRPDADPGSRRAGGDLRHSSARGRRRGAGWQAAAARGSEPASWGDRRSLQILEAARQGAAAGRGQVVGVVGEPGVGKSRLFYEFTHSEPHRRVAASSSTGSVSYGKATAYVPLIDLLRVYFELDDRRRPKATRDRPKIGLRDLGDVLHSAIPALLTLLDVPVEDESWRKLDPERRRQARSMRSSASCCARARCSLSCCSFEDLHWIDSETQALLDSLVDSLPTARLLLLVNYRPEYRHGWGGKTYYTQLRLDPLRPRAPRRLLRTLLGEDAAFAAAQASPDRAHRGQSLLPRGKRSGRWLEIGVLARRARAPIASASLSPVSRCRPRSRRSWPRGSTACAPEDKRLLQCAAVIGENVPVDLLQAVADMAEDEAA